MSDEELFLWLAKNVQIRIEDASTPRSCGGECQGSLGVKVSLLARNPYTGRMEEIASDRCDLMD